MDDDIVVDVMRIYQQILKENSSTSDDRDNSMFGYIQMGLPVQRSLGWKWALDKKELKEDYHPDFLSGWAYITTPKVASKLVNASKNIPLLWIDDVWVTGYLAQHLNIQHQARLHSTTWYFYQ